MRTAWTVLTLLNLIQDNMTVVKKKRKKHLRNLKRNKSGRNATVKMTYGSGDVDGKKVYRAYPSITFKGNEKAKPQSYKEAGEVYEFKRKKRAERFAAGSWKKGKAKREAMKAYRAKKKSERQAKRNK